MRRTLLAKISGCLAVVEVSICPMVDGKNRPIKCPRCKQDMQSRYGWIECFECDIAYNEGDINKICSESQLLGAVPLWGT